MSLPLFASLLNSGAQDNTLRFTWDDVHYQKPYEELDEALLERMERLSQRACVAFAIACAEWIVYRFGKVSDDSTPSEYLEAAWAALVDARYVYYHEPEMTEWEGPVRRPLAAAMMLVVDAIVRMEDDDHPAINAVSLGALAEHVLTHPAPFRQWRERTLVRLERLYPLDATDTRGAIVPREALDPDFDFHPEQAAELLGRYLEGLDPESNMFLASPEDMEREGFEGEPYKLA